MNRNPFRLALPLFASCALLAIITPAVLAQQEADAGFDAKVARPAYTRKHPRVLFDEAHFNFHTTTGRYKPFADLIGNDGYAVVANKEKFQKKVLEGYDLLVIANALGAETQASPGSDKPAFTEEECDAVREWVRAGGSLLLIADHAPFGSAAEALAKRFGVDMSKGYAVDMEVYDREDGNTNRSFLVFSRDNHLLQEHPITQGRDATERVSRVVTFTGQSLKGPEGSVAFLKLSDTARDRQPPSKDSEAVTVDRLPNGQQLPPGVTARGRPAAGPPVSAAGRAQGIALTFGKGRVVVLGEAAMLSAQKVTGVAAQLMGKDEIRLGMNRPGLDNRQLALNIMHWLSRLLN
ncbi:MAG TPA: hypothetical protein VJT09_17430 [Pyrinomonadaceae bacterium]|nr:hypothetical protein [Pyrinomonadaceae bacterium]